jgi:hypothetical protein
MVFKSLLPVVEYVVNYEYISKVLCVNKAKPELQCNGKCHLMKELAKASENEKPITDKRIVVKEVEVLFFQEIKTIAFSKIPYSKKVALNAKYCNLYTSINSDKAFHPPTYIS